MSRKSFSREFTIIDQIVGRNIRIRRRDLGWTQSKLADACGVSFQQVQKYENGTNRLSAGRLFFIAHVMEVPILSFFAGAQEVVPLSDEALLAHRLPHNLGDDARALVHAFETIHSKDARKHLLGLARLMEAKAE